MEHLEQSPIDYLVGEMKQIEENLFKEVLRQVLKREPTIEDAKECSFLKKDNWDLKYVIAYRGVNLGTVEVHLHPDYKISFTPI